MATRRVDIFDIKQLEQLQKDLIKMKIKAQTITDDEMRKVMEYGVRLVQSKSQGKSPMATGKTAQSTKYEKTGHLKYEITQNSPGAIYFEYGTGIVGAANPHPQPIGGYTGKEKWVYKGPDGKFHTTSGQRANRQMYDSAKELRAFYKQHMVGAMKKISREVGK